MSKTPDDDLYCRECQSINVREVSRQRYVIGERDRNWEQGVPIHVCLNHLERHLNLYKSGDRSEDHLAKIRVNAGFIIHFEEKDNDRISNSELVGFNYPDSPRATSLQSHRQTHFDGSLPNAGEEG